MNNLESKTFGEIVVGIARELSGYFLILIATASVLLFIWGIVKYIYKAESEAERTKGRNLMLWGIIGFFVFFGIWAIVTMIGTTFGVDVKIPPQFDAGGVPIPFVGPPAPSR
jgi:phosphate starvation-inducible membrane PsiE